MSAIEVLFLSKEDVDSLELSLEDMLAAVEMGLDAHGRKDVLLPSKDHIPLNWPQNIFNILKGYVGPIQSVGVKVLGDFSRNHEHGLPSELSTLLLIRPETGAPYAIVNSTAITWMRTGAVTAMGAKHLARKDSKVLGHIGARGTSWYNVAMMDLIFDFDEIRVTSKRPESRERFCRIMSERLGKEVRVMDNCLDTVRDADIIIDASRLTEEAVLVPDRAVKPGALLQAYGAVLSVERTLPFSVDKFFVDDWNQCHTSKYGTFAGMIQEGAIRDEHVHGEIGEVVAGIKPGRESDEERILFWHKGFAISDIVLGHLAFEKAKERGVGTMLTYHASPRDE
ncbi:MAG: ornithine cyclodeaminase family protein [Thiotrichales bacterium]|nr:ornithine cyclodeaminase family protein [Thiotrichales bacterium]